MARSSYKQLNKEADQCGYGTFETQLIKLVFAGKDSDVDFLLGSASCHAKKKVLLDLIRTLGECHEWYSQEQVEKVVGLAIRIVEQLLNQDKETQITSEF